MEETRKVSTFLGLIYFEVVFKKQNSNLKGTVRSSIGISNSQIKMQAEKKGHSILVY